MEKNISAGKRLRSRDRGKGLGNKGEEMEGSI